MKRKRPIHPLAGQRVQAAGAPDGGYLIPESGLINARATDGSIVRPPFNVPKNIGLSDVAAKLEAHVSSRSGDSAAQPVLPPGPWPYANWCDVGCATCARRPPQAMPPPVLCCSEGLKRCAGCDAMGCSLLFFCNVACQRRTACPHLEGSVDFSKPCSCKCCASAGRVEAANFILNDADHCGHTCFRCGIHFFAPDTRKATFSGTVWCSDCRVESRPCPTSQQVRLGPAFCRQCGRPAMWRGQRAAGPPPCDETSPTCPSCSDTASTPAAGPVIGGWSQFGLLLGHEPRDEEESRQHMLGPSHWIHDTFNERLAASQYVTQLSPSIDVDEDICRGPWH